MTFRELIVRFNPIQNKNSLNDLLALVERNFGVFSRDMELDIRAIIVNEEVKSYFDRIIHEDHPQLEYDKEKQTKKKVSDTPDDIERKKKKKAEKKRRKEERKKGVNPELTLAQEQSKHSQKGNTRSKWDFPDYVLRRLVKNGRDYSKETIASQVRDTKLSDREKWEANRVHIISVPMGGQNKKY
jgi:hypothetical protein